MLDVVVYSGIVLLFLLGVAPVVMDMLKEYLATRWPRKAKPRADQPDPRSLT